MTTERPPFLSVVIPSYNSAEWLPQTIDSILAQTFSDFEVVIVDDGSKDDTREVVGRYVAQTAGKVRYLPQDNAGPSAARNNGVRAARGEWIAFLDADDWWDPGKLAAQLEVLRQHPDVSAIFTDVRMSRNGVETRNGVTAGMTSTGDPAQILELIVREVCFPTTALVRKSALDEIGGFLTKYKGPEDIDLWLRLFVGRKFYFLMEALAVHRVVDSSLSHSAGADRANGGLIQVYKEFVARPEVPERFRERGRKAIAQYYFDWGWSYLADGKGQAARLFATSWLHDMGKVSALKWSVLSLLPRGLYRSRVKTT